mmetsp:Transcript_11120/g.28119  ORF Transcript_11120/g.28119 Transcript_11120/m.28119 type:complete len:210 (-) Transcript_11120:61-690(-)
MDESPESCKRRCHCHRDHLSSLGRCARESLLQHSGRHFERASEAHEPCSPHYRSHCRSATLLQCLEHASHWQPGDCCPDLGNCSLCHCFLALIGRMIHLRTNGHRFLRIWSICTAVLSPPREGAARTCCKPPPVPSLVQTHANPLASSSCAASSPHSRSHSRHFPSPGSLTPCCHQQPPQCLRPRHLLQAPPCQPAPVARVQASLPRKS